MVRQSNLVSLATDKPGPHTLLVKHVTRIAASLLLCFPTTKTRSSDQSALLFSLPALPEYKISVLSAWTSYVASRTLNPDDSALQLQDGSYLTAALLSRVLSLAASAVLPVSAGITLHSLRRGAAQACLKAGVPVTDIQEAGSWTSASMLSYFSQDPISRAP